MQSAAETVENASILSGGSAQDGHRLWIGNIDPKITEYHLVKLLEKFGKVKQFDFLFHKSGPLEGQPRGYCFVNFHTKEEAERAIQCLNGKLALSKKLVVRWAHAQKFEPFRGDKNLPASLEPSSSEAEELPTTLSVNAKIRAIEAKLQMMEENPDDYSGPSAYIYNKPPIRETKGPSPTTSSSANSGDDLSNNWPSVADCEICGDKLLLSLGQCETVTYHEKTEPNTFDLQCCSVSRPAEESFYCERQLM